MDDKTCSTNTCSTEKNGEACKSQCKKIMLGGLLGGAVMFVWVMISWMALPWHNVTINEFTDDAAVATVLAENAPQSGIYVLPRMTMDPEQAPVMAKPFAFMSVVSEGVDMSQMGGKMFVEFLSLFFMAAMLTAVLARMGSGCKVMASLKIGAVVAVASYLPMWNWWHFPVKYTLVGMADVMIAMFLAGLVLAKFVFKDGPCRPCGK